MSKLQRIIAAVSTVAILSSFVVTTQVFALAGVPEWGQQYVDALVEAGAVDGTKEDFNGGSFVNRAEFAKMASYAFDLSEGGTQDFSDVAEDDWFYSDVQKLVAAGAVNGYPDGSFGPERNINRAEAAKILVELAGLEPGGMADFDDVAEGEWFTGYVAVAAEQGWVSGYADGTFRPGDYINRAETAKVIAVSAGLVEAPTPEPEPEEEEISGDLTVSLSSMSPDTASIPSRASSVAFAAFDFEADEDAVVNEVVVEKKGVVSDSVFDGFYLYQGSKRLTSRRSLNSEENTVTFSNLDVEVDAGKTVTLVLRADMAVHEATGDARFQITSADSVEANGGSVGGSFPVRGELMTIQSTEAGMVTISRTGTVSNPTIGEVAKVAEFRLEAADEDALLEELALTVKGSIDESGVTELELKDSTGTVLATADGVEGDENLATFVLPETYVIPEGSSRTFRVFAKVVGDSGDTIEVYLDEKTDLLAVGDEFGFGLFVTNNYDSAQASTTELEGGDVTFAFNGPAARDVSLDGEGVHLLEFSVTTVSEITIEEMNFNIFADDNADSDPFDGTDDGNDIDADGLINADTDEANLTDIKVINLDTGRTVMSAEELAVAGDDASQTLTYTDSFTLDAGESVDLTLVVDITDAAAFVDTTIGAELLMDVDADELVVEDARGDDVAADEVVPGTDMQGNTMTVIDAEMFLTLAGTPTSDSFVKGTENVPMAGVNFRAADAEDVTVTQVSVTCYIDGDLDGDFDTPTDAGDSVRDFIGSVSLYLDGEKVAGPTSLDTDAQAVFDDMDWTLMAGDSENLIIKADLARQATVSNELVACGIENATDVVAQDEDGDDVEADSAINNEAVLDAGNGVEIEVLDGGTLSFREEGSTDETILIAGTQDVMVAKYKFTAVDEAFTVNDLDVVMLAAGDANANTADDTNASAYTRVTVKYPTQDGEGEQNRNFSAGEAKFTGLDMYVPEGGNAFLEVYVDLNTIDAGAESGAVVRVAVQDSTNTAVNDFEATGVGSGDTVMADTVSMPADISGIEAHYLRETKPMVALVGDKNGVLVSGVQELIEFTVTADEAQSVSLTQLAFRVQHQNDGDGQVENFSFYKVVTKLLTK